jgi:hypothetical protein
MATNSQVFDWAVQVANRKMVFTNPSRQPYVAPVENKDVTKPSSSSPLPAPKRQASAARARQAA